MPFCALLSLFSIGDPPFKKKTDFKTIRGDVAVFINFPADEFRFLALLQLEKRLNLISSTRSIHCVIICSRFFYMTLESGNFEIIGRERVFDNFKMANELGIDQMGFNRPITISNSGDSLKYSID